MIIHNDEDGVKFMRKTFESTAENLKVDLKIKEMREEKIREGKFEKYIKRAAEKFNFNILLFVLPNNLKQAYSEFKK